MTQKKSDSFVLLWVFMRVLTESLKKILNPKFRKKCVYRCENDLIFIYCAMFSIL